MFLWENGGPMVDLRALLTNNPGMTLTELNYISDRGEIAGDGVLPNGDNRAILLVPCDEDHSDVEGCDFETFEPTAIEGLNSALATSAAAAAVNQPKVSADEMVLQMRSLRANRNRRWGNLPQK